MTALKPIENTTHVRGVAAKRYPPNEVCAVPGCDKPAESYHHIFGRPPGEHSDSWFVTLYEGGPIIPHAIGLCGSGTTGHHGDVEEHRAWIKLEEREFVWYERERVLDTPDLAGPFTESWVSVGPLDPQPARGEKRKKVKRFKGAEKRKRTTISIRVPKDEQEDGAGLWDDLMERVSERLEREGLDGSRPPYYLLSDALNDWLNDWFNG